ncbi:polysaccharide deacetylase family protein [Actinoplanes sp. DH11]|uniref:polysaccharide deacetylase family protein n=1 Tax=Actinoplanes sp. DH11 TaxID=2857011 RepID=UPI001E53E2C1|nr:polysaccharide deacetylase family protein [Actinoplanes sp. DH11]
MLPHNPRPSAPNSGADGTSGGRHRRPETPESAPAESHTGGTPAQSRSAAPTRRARHRAGTRGSYGSSRTARESRTAFAGWTAREGWTARAGWSSRDAAADSTAQPGTGSTSPAPGASASTDLAGTAPTASTSLAGATPAASASADLAGATPAPLVSASPAGELDQTAGAGPTDGAAQDTPTDQAAAGAGRPTRSARHARAGRRPATVAVRRSTAAGSRPGSHRASGARTVDGLLQAARNRPQLLLGTLVVAGLLLIAAPTIPQQDGAPTSVMNAAAQAVASRVTSSKPAAAPTKEAAAQPPARNRPESTRTATAPTAAATEKPPAPDVQPARVTAPRGDGPANSLVTTGSRTVTLSFDDGPDPNETPKLLQILAQHQVKAVFCLVGTQAQRHPDLVRQIAAAGHVLCNHTWDHDLKIGKKKPEQIRADLTRTSDAIRAAVPGAAIPYFRAPGGNFTVRLVNTAYADGMTSLYWDVDPRDWFHPAGESQTDHVKRLISEVQAKTRPGSIILSHDFNQPATTEAYRQLMPWLTANFEVGVPGGKPAPSSAPSATPTTEPTPSAPATTTPAPSASTPAPSGSPAASGEPAAAGAATPPPSAPAGADG